MAGTVWLFHVHSGISSFVCDLQFLIHHDANHVVEVTLMEMLDQILATGLGGSLKYFFSLFDQIFSLGDSKSGLYRLCFYGLNRIQNEYFTFSIGGDKNLCAINPFPLSLVCWRQAKKQMNAIEWTAFISVNASIGWVGITVSVICSFYSSYFQQKLPEAHVSGLMPRGPTITILKLPRTLSFCISSPRQYPKMPHWLRSLMQVIFIWKVSTARLSEACTDQIICVCLNVLTWASHKLWLPVNATAAAELCDGLDIWD